MAEQAEPGAVPVRRPRTRPKKSTSSAGSLLCDDMQFADLLDGTLMPSIGNAPVAPMSSQTDSIISLAPLNGAVPAWKNLEGSARPRERHTRHSSLGGPELRTMVPRRRLPNSPLGKPLSGRPSVTAASLLAVATPRLPDREPSAVPDIRIDMDTGSVSRHPRQPSIEIEPRDRPIGTGKKPSYGTMEGSNRNALAYVFPKKEEDEMSAGGSSHNGSLRSRNSRRNRASRRKRGLPISEDSGQAWHWRFPGAEDALMPSMAWVYLPLIGWLIFASAVTVNTVEQYITKLVISPSAEYAKARWGGSAGMLTLSMVRAAVLVLSFGVVFRFAPMHGPGSGIPEMKCVLTGVFMPNVLSASTLMAKMAGLSLASASGISVGRLGPFMHMGGIIASQVSNIPLFKDLSANPLFKLQALSAAMAAGVGATFGAPIGGAMLAIELMSTYYYVHWLPMSLFCSIMGYYLVLLFLDVANHAFFTPDISLSLHAQPVFGILVYGSLGVVCGFTGWILIRFTVLMKKTVSYFFNISRHPLRIVIFLAFFAIVHTYSTGAVGGLLMEPQKKGVEKMFALPRHELIGEWLNPGLQVFGPNSWGSSFCFFVAMLVKFLLTGISLVLPIPAGTFMPIFEIGALLGRSYGELMSGLPGLAWIDPRATAIVGAASLTSGTLHVTSVAVVMLELTREAVNVLPITISVVVAYAVSKSMCSDLFSELIKFRQLPYMLGLRERSPQETQLFYEEIAPVVAKSFMEKKFMFVTPKTTASAARKLLASQTSPVVAFLNDEKERKLYGVIKRSALERELDIMRLRSQATSSGAGSVADAAGISAGVLPPIGYVSEGRNGPVPFLSEFDPKLGHPLVDMGAMQVSVHTPFWKVITYFRMLSMNVMYVMTTDGSVAGVITKLVVAQQCYDLERQAKEKKRLQKEVELQTRRAEKEAEKEAATKYAGSQRLSRKIARKMSQSNLVGMDQHGRRSRNASLKLSGLR